MNAYERYLASKLNGDIEDWLSKLEKTERACVLDSIVKKQGYLNLAVALDYSIVPDSLFCISEKSIQIISHSKDSCLLEVGLLLLKQKQGIPYTYKNNCKASSKEIPVKELIEKLIYSD